MTNFIRQVMTYTNYYNLHFLFTGVRSQTLHCCPYNISIASNILTVLSIIFWLYYILMHFNQAVCGVILKKNISVNYSRN